MSVKRVRRHLLLLLATGVGWWSGVLLGLPHEVITADIGLLSMLELIIRKWQALWSGHDSRRCGPLVDMTRLLVLMLLLIFHL